MISNLERTYEIQEKIGSGGGGAVYKAYHKRLEKLVVIKKIHKEVQDILNSRQETDILKNLRHPYLPQVLDFFEIDGEIYTVMDYIPGESLQQLLDSGRTFSQKEIVKWAKQLADALCYLHQQNPPIIHGDIKPANVMLMPDGDICLIDFNISSVFDSDRRGARTLGYSNGYSPLEQYPDYAKSQAVPSGQAAAEENCTAAYDREEENVSHTVAYDREKGETASHTVAYDRERVETVSHTVAYDREKGETVSHTVAYDRERVETVSHTATYDRTNREAQVRVNAPENIPVLPKEAAGTPKKAELPYVRIDERSDIYSFGATLYHMVSGVRPEKATQKVTPITRRDVPISDGLAYVITKCMEPSPDRRFSSVAKLRKTLDQLEKLDRRYKRFVLQEEVAVIGLMVLLAASVLCVYSGKQLIYKDNVAKYNACMDQIEEWIAEGNYKPIEEKLKQAENLLPNQLRSQYEQLLFQYAQGQYEEVFRLMESLMEKNVPLESEEAKVISECYSVAANAAFDRQDYKRSAEYWKKAMAYWPTEVSYCRDYAISLARDGQLIEADQILSQAIDRGIKEDSVYLAEGEIAHTKGEYKKAENSFRKCLDVSKDDYIRMRAYVICSMTYQDGKKIWKDGDKKAIALLEQADKELPAAQNLVVHAKLIEDYVAYGKKQNNTRWYKKAIRILEEDMAIGRKDYQNMANLSLLYRKTGNYEKSQEILSKMLKEYGEKYETYKKQAFLEADIQSSLPNNRRSYETFYSYYKKAMNLYTKQAEQEDSEMVYLKQIYSELVEGNWLSESE
ncbi:MAG: protein kinase [Clostridiales bacterium]|nr:protein kinase [Clostridiales bacterium]